MVKRYLELHNIEKIPELLSEYRKTDSLMLSLVFMHWVLVSTLSGMFYNTYLLGFVGGGVLFGVTLLGFKTLSGTPAFRIIVALVLMSFTIISIQQNLGRIEMHFHVFVVLSFLSAYKDLKPVSVASVYIIIHHFLFNYLQQYNVELLNTPVVVFSYGCGLDIVLLHGFFVLFEWMVLLGIISKVTKTFLAEVESKHVLQKQAVELKKLAAVFESTDEGIVITDEHGDIISVNKAFEEVTGYSKASALGKNPRFLKSGRHDPVFYEQMWQALKEKGVWKGEIWNKNAQEEIIPIWLTISVVKNRDNEVINYIGLWTDLSQIVKAHEKINYMAYHDTLTQLPNRDYFKQQLQHAIGIAKRNHTKMALLFIDLDRFKIINDTLGHQVGDELLKAVAGKISGVLRESDLLARIGGDEFLVLLENIKYENNAAVVAEKIITALMSPMMIGEHTLYTTASIGIAIFPDDGEDCMALIKSADSAMYHAKDVGKNTYEYYTNTLSEKMHRHMALENALRSALENEEFSLVFQPQYDLLTRKTIGAEALLRWNSPDLGFVSPDEFIPIAEESRAIIAIGEWVFEYACREFLLWQKSTPDLHYVSVNVSSVQFEHYDIVNRFTEIVKRVGIKPSNVEIEITERYIMQHTEGNSNLLEQLRDNGFRIAIDDFGTGYSSMSYLKTLPLDTIKIDKSFVDELPHDENSIAIVKAIMALSKSLNYSVVAEGIEEQEQELFLKELGCDIGQGYFFSRPISNEQMIELLKG